MFDFGLIGKEWEEIACLSTASINRDPKKEMFPASIYM